jgi:hypothetical protein
MSPATTKKAQVIVYDCSGDPPDGAIDGTEELLSGKTRAETRSTDRRFDRLIARALEQD